MKAAFIADRSFATTSINMMLCEVFGQANVYPIEPSDVRPAIVQEMDFFLLPGIAGETSPYPELLPSPKADLIKKVAEDKGIILWTDCAATYWISDSIDYSSLSGEKKRRSGLGWVGATTKGPLRGKAMPPTMEKQSYADTTTVAIEYDVEGETFNTGICYGNGPGLLLTKEELENPDVRIVARYLEYEDRPVAAMTKIIGNGLLVSLGVLPQIKTSHLVGYFNDDPTEQHRQKLFNAVAAHETGIRHFEDSLFKQIFEQQNKYPKSKYPERLYA